MGCMRDWKAKQVFECTNCVGKIIRDHQVLKLQLHHHTDVMYLFLQYHQLLYRVKTSLHHRNEICMVETLDIKGNFLQKCGERNDVWGEKAHLLSMRDLTNPSERSVGRPLVDRESFLKLCNYVEQSDKCQYSI
ncbi:hypothetical protein PR048_001626 [Dryococelus australis]|uniref:Uncharacterized protein n=1 Tax=Dryococelus australis TaxID=614101 RepID=A0ABQ9IHV3_9NEOP|nr:hypothetical protein PR048_001626 [Dryococelus australis]